MKVFISWSGPLSRHIAEILRDWLPAVLQTVEPYVSSEDIDKGARWSVEVSRELELANYGILCVTAANMYAPWLNFEAGALSKSFEEGNVAPFLFDIKPSDLVGPLTQFQITVFKQDDIFKLITSINAASEVPLEPSRLRKAFKIWWPELQEKLDHAKDLVPSQEQIKSAKRPVEEMVTELLELVRTEQRMLYALDQRIPQRTALTVELEALQKLVEELLDKGVVYPDDLTTAIPKGSISPKYKDWLSRILSYVPRPASASEDEDSGFMNET